MLHGAQMAASGSTEDGFLYLLNARIRSAFTDRPSASQLHFLRDGERIFELDAEVAHRAIHLRMAEQ